MSITLLFEMVIIFMVGSLSIVEGVRLTLHKGPQLYDIVGPGLYNVGIGVLLLSLGGIYFLLRSQRKHQEKTAEDRRYRLTMMKMVGILAAYIVLINLTGYFLSTLMFFISIHRVVGFNSWRTNIVASLAASLAFYGIFVRMLNMIFPTGVLFGF